MRVRGAQRRVLRKAPSRGLQDYRRGGWHAVGTLSLRSIDSRLGTPLVIFFLILTVFLQPPDDVPNKRLPSSTTSLPAQRSSVTFYSLITSTPACRTSRHRGGCSVGITRQPCVLEAGKLAALYLVALFLSFYFLPLQQYKYFSRKLLDQVTTIHLKF